MAGTQAERRRDEPVVEVRIPITTVPTRRGAEDPQITQLRTGLARAETEIRSLQEYFRSIRVPPTQRTASDINSEADRISQALDRMDLLSNPVLGERYRDELELLRNEITLARNAVREGRLGAAIEILDQVNSQIGVLGLIFQEELTYLVNGIPTNVRIEGVAPENVTTALFDGFEGALRDIGGTNERRGRNIIRAFNLLTRHPGEYNCDNPLAAAERNNVHGYIVVRGRQAASGAEYTAQMASADAALLQSFESNVATLQSQIRNYNISVFTAWRSDIASLVQGERDEQTRQSLESLNGDLDAILRRLRANQQVSDEEMRTITQRYFTLSGRQAPMSEQDRFARIRERATELRGAGRTVADGSAEWFAQRALDLLVAGNTQLASLALSMGLLERASGRNGARQYLGEYGEIRDLVTRGITPTPALLSRYQSQIETASLSLDAERLLNDYGTGRGHRAQRERIASAVRTAQQRLASGDISGASRLLEMTNAYADLLVRNNWGSWQGSDQMESSLDSENRGQNASEAFGNVLTYQAIAQQLDDARTFRGRLGRQMSEPKEIFDAVIARIEEMGRAGNFREATRGLTLLLMYTDAIQRLGVMRNNQVVSLESSAQFAGMNSALRAYARGQTTVDNNPVDTVFSQSYTMVQQTYVGREVARLRTLSARREFGRDDVNAALDAAERRATAGDLRGAVILVEYVKEFYGSEMASTATTPARTEGWRYALMSGRQGERIVGYREGRTQMLEAIRLETNATDERTHTSAAQLYLQGATRVVQTESLMQQADGVAARYHGTGQFIPGNADSVGRIPLERHGDEEQQYLTLDAMRTYETTYGATDPHLRGRRTMEQLLGDLAEAARTGDTAQYNAVVRLLSNRTDEVFRRSIRFMVITQIQTRITEIRGGLGELRAHYDGDVYNTDALRDAAHARQASVDAISARANTLSTTLTGMITNDEPLTAESAAMTTLSGIVTDAGREGRIGSTLAYLNQQITVNEQFRRAVAAERSDRAADVARRLVTANGHFADARVSLINGNLETAFRHYRNAIGQVQMALVFYRAEDSPYIDQVDMGDVIRLVPVPRGRPTDYEPISGADLRFFPSLRAYYALHGHPQRPDFIVPFDFYLDGSLAVFNQMLSGHADGFISQADLYRRTRPGYVPTIDDEGTIIANPNPQRTLTQQRVQDIARAVVTTAISTFAAPQGEVRSMLLTDYAQRQINIRRNMRNIVMRGYGGDAGRQLTDGYFQMADNDLQWMEQRAQHDRKVEMYTMIGVGIACLFIPKVGWAISGTIFTMIAWDRVQTEIRMDGHASTEAWVMFGVSIGTLGLGGIAAGLSRTALAIAEGAEGANAASRILLATRVANVARGINYFNLGVGLFFVGYGTAAGIDAIAHGRTEEGIVGIGLSVFPLVHMAGARAISAYQARSIPRATVLETTRVLEAGTPVQEGAVNIPVSEPEGVVRAREFQRNPRALLDWIGEYLAAAPARQTAMMEALPQNVRSAIQGLLGNESVLAAARGLRAGRLTDIRAAAQLAAEVARSFELPAEVGNTSVGTRPQIDVAGLTDPEALRAFLADLLVPDSGSQAQLNARAAARGRLAAMRESNPQAANTIDALLRAPAVQEGVRSGSYSQFADAMIGRAVRQLQQSLPPDVNSAAARATGTYDGVLNAQAMAVPDQPGAPAQGEPVAGGRAPQIRASAGDQGGPQGPRQGTPPGRVTTTGGTGEPVTGGTVQPPDQVRPPPRMGKIEYAARSVGRFFRARWASIQARRAIAPSPEEFMGTARDALDATVRSVVREAEMPGLVRDATEGMQGAEATEVGNATRTAPRRVAEMVKALFRASARGTPQDQASARRALLRLFSFENVRTVLGELAASDAELARALRQMELLARTGSGGARPGTARYNNFLRGMAERGFDTTEVQSIIMTMEREGLLTLRDGSVMNLADARAQLGRLNTNITQLERTLAQQERTAAAATGDAQQAANARAATTRQQLTDAMTARDELAGAIRTLEQTPLFSTERALGLSISPSERAPMMLDLLNRGIIQPDAITSEYLGAIDRVRARVNGMDVNPGGETVQGRARPNPVLEAMRRSMDTNAGRSNSADDAVLAALRSDEVLGAIRRRYGNDVATRFEAAVRTGDLDAVLSALGNEEGAALRDAFPQAEREALAGFARNARTALGEDYAVMGVLEGRANGILNTEIDGALAAGESLAPARRQIAGSRPAQWGASALRAGGRALRWLFWDVGGGQAVSNFRNGWATRDLTWMPFIRGTGRIGVQLGIWGLAGYYVGAPIVRGIYRWIRDAPDTEAAIRGVRERWGVVISEQNANWIRGNQVGQDYFNHIPNSFPTGPSRRPETRAQMEQILNSTEIVIDPQRLEEVVTDGRNMSDRLARINELLQTRRTATGDAQTAATNELNTILRNFGGITLDQVDAMLASKHKTSLDITDMYDLRIDDWVRRGIAARRREVVIETFLSDSGMTVQRGQGAALWLGEHRDVFLFLWDAVRNGFLPVTYVDDAVNYLMTQGTLEGLQSRVGRGATLDSLLREALMGQHLYLEVPTGTGQTQGILMNSFLGLLDSRAALDPSFRPTYETLLARYRDNPAALTAFNRFNVTTGDRGEALYGDMNALAELIVANPATALDQARQRGMVGPAILGEVDHSLINSPELVLFVMQHSDREHDAGLLRWIRDRRDAIVSLAPILRDLQTNPQVANMDVSAIVQYADQQAGRYRSQGWWRGPTPQEIADEAEAARRRQRLPPGGAQQQQRSREDVMRDENAPRYPRRGGDVFTPRDAVPVRTQDQQLAAPAPIVMSPEAQRFFDSADRSSGLGQMIDNLVDAIFNESNARNPDRVLFEGFYRNANSIDRDQAKRELRMEVYRILTSNAQRDQTLVRGFGITVTGTGDAMTVTIGSARAIVSPLRQRMIEYTRERRASAGGR